jgi:hypothetical protein
VGELGVVFVFPFNLAAMAMGWLFWLIFIWAVIIFTGNRKLLPGKS